MREALLQTRVETGLAATEVFPDMVPALDGWLATQGLAAALVAAVREQAPNGLEDAPAAVQASAEQEQDMTFSSFTSKI